MLKWRFFKFYFMKNFELYYEQDRKYFCSFDVLHIFKNKMFKNYFKYYPKKVDMETYISFFLTH